MDIKKVELLQEQVLDASSRVATCQGFAKPPNCSGRPRILAPAWGTLDEALKVKLMEVGINPTPKPTEPDLTDVLKENLASLPAPVKERANHEAAARIREGHGISVEAAGDKTTGHLTPEAGSSAEN